VKALTLICVAAAALALAACGESDQQKAKKQVCSASSDIKKQVNELKALTPATATSDGVKSNLNAIRDDLKKIADAQPQLDDQRKAEVKTANEKFVSEFQSLAGDVGKSLSASAARAQLQTAFQQLAASYQSAFSKVDCGSS
jgi:hypothetical protein